MSSYCLMTPNIVYGGTSKLSTLDIEADLTRTLGLGERRQIDIIMSFVTMICELFHEQTLRTPESFYQAYYCGMERFCRRYAAQDDIIDLLQSAHSEVLRVLIRRFFEQNTGGHTLPQMLKELFSQDLQNILLHLPKGQA